MVGGGNSACDVAVEAAQAFGPADISLRRGYWFLPKSFLGIPLAEWDRPWMPVPIQRQVVKLAARAPSFGRYERYGLERPDHRPFDKHPTVNRAPYFLRHGRVRPRRDIERLDGRTVHFADGTSRDYDTIVWATGFNISFPFLDRGTVRVAERRAGPGGEPLRPWPRQPLHLRSPAATRRSRPARHRRR